MFHAQLFSHVWLFAALMDYSPPGSSVHGISQERILEWGAIAFSRGLPNPGLEPSSPALEGRFFTTKPPGKPGTLFFPLWIFSRMGFEWPYVILFGYMHLDEHLSTHGDKLCFWLPSEQENKDFCPFIPPFLFRKYLWRQFSALRISTVIAAWGGVRHRKARRLYWSELCSTKSIRHREEKRYDPEKHWIVSVEK